MDEPPILHHPILGDIVILGKLARGGYASIWKAYCVEMKTHVCLKIDEKRQSATENEFKMMKLLNHPLTCQFYGEFRSGNNVGAVIEFIDGLTILDYVNQHGVIKESFARYLFLELVSIIQHLHCELNMIHQDLKCENIMIDTHNNLHLIDFGFAHLDSDTIPLSYSGYGTPGYISPEVISGGRYTFSSDIFSIGILLYCMIIGKLPFAGANPSEIFQKTVKDAAEIPDGVSPDAADLINKLIDKDPINRPSISSILEHPWLNPIVRGIRLSPDLTHLRMLDKYPNGTLDQRVLDLFRSYGYSVEDLINDITNNIDSKLVAYYLFLRNIQISTHLGDIQLTLFVHDEKTCNSSKSYFSRSTPGFGHQNQPPNKVHANLSMKIKNPGTNVIRPKQKHPSGLPPLKKLH